MSESQSVEISSQRPRRVQKKASPARHSRDEKLPTPTASTPSRGLGGAAGKVDSAAQDGGFVFRYRTKVEQDADAKAVYEQMVAHLRASGQDELAMSLPLWNEPAPLHPEREKLCLEMFGVVPSLPRTSAASAAFVKRQQPPGELKISKRARRRRISKS